jgi:hypothetical protein
MMKIHFCRSYVDRNPNKRNVNISPKICDKHKNKSIHKELNMSKFSVNSLVLAKILFIFFVPFLLASYSWSVSSESSTDATVGIIFYADNGEDVVLEANVETGSSIVVPTAPVKSGYTFTHWQEIGGDETIENGVVYYNVTRDIEFKAQYTPNMYTVTFLNYDDSVAAQINTTQGSSITVPQALPRTGYTFTHWQELGGTETIPDGVSNYTVTKTTMFKAQYTPIVYTVTFLDYDDTQVAQINATQGSSITVPTTSNRTGYTFTHWQELGGSETIADGVTTYTVTKTIIFKAQYTAVSEYTIIFLDDNDTVVAEINATAGTSIQVPNAPPKSGYTFTQWKEVDGSETIASGVTTYTPTKNITFKAEYSLNPIVYTVTFLKENGDNISTQQVNSGESAVVPTPPPKADYTFTHWQEVGGSETIASGVSSYTPTKSITFKATYTPIIYTIKFLEDDNTLAAEINATAGTSIQVPTAQVIPGYTFTSWLEVGGTERIPSTSSTYTVTRSVTFKAQYNPITYTATFLAEDGVTVVGTPSGTYGSYIQVPNAPAKTGYTFTHWQEVGGSETIPSGTTSYMLTRNVTFKAEYIEGIEIRTQADLNNVRYNLSGKYKLMNDIALSDNGEGYGWSGWLPIGMNSIIPSEPFTGTFDGNGHKITGLWISGGGTGVGLFGSASGAIIKNLGVEISNIGIIGENEVGGIVGRIDSGTITNSYVTGSVGIYGGGIDVGGIAGVVWDATITNSYSTASVSGDFAVGGIVGSIINGGTIANTYSTGSVSCNDSYIGGIVAMINAGSITNNAAINPSVACEKHVDRIAGWVYPSGTTVSNNFALNSMSVTGSTDSGNAGTSKTITELTTQSTYSIGLGWRFGNDDANPWKHDPYKNGGLPYLYWENR